jgi:cytochrome d ubiquinol oxidase subunit II
MTLSSFWFLVIALLWTGFLVLEGFDFGVGMLHGVIGRDEAGKRAVIHTIGPVWDGNEVWLIVAGAGMFAAFPSWYATMFSSFYLVMLLLLVVLILRGLSFEFRGKRDSPRWRRSWDLAQAGGSLMVPLVVGVALSDLLRGLPIDSAQEFRGNVLDLLSGYSVFGGITFVLICLSHGAAFLALKTAGELRNRAIVVARWVAPVTAAAVIAFMIWTRVVSGRGFLPSIVEIAAILAVIAAALLVASGRDGWAFTATAITMGAVVVSLFTDLYPRVMVSTLGSANNLTVNNTSSSSYALKVMTVVTVILLPVVVAYQAWSYYTFRRRISRTPVRGGEV